MMPSLKHNVKRHSNNKVVKPIYVFDKNGKRLNKFDHYSEVFAYVKGLNNIYKVMERKFPYKGEYYFSHRPKLSFKPSKEKLHSNNKIVKPVFIFDRDGKFLVKYEKPSEAFAYIGAASTAYYCIGKEIPFKRKYYLSYSRKLSFKPAKNKSVYAFNDDGKLIGKFFDSHEAADKLNIPPNNIWSALRSGNKGKGYFFSYDKTFGKQLITKRKEELDNLPVVYCFDKQGKLLCKYNNSQDAAENNCLNKHLIHEAINIQSFKYKKYFSYNEYFVPPKFNLQRRLKTKKPERALFYKDTPVYCFDKDGVLLGKFRDSEDAASSLTIMEYSIRSSVKSGYAGKGYFFSHKKTFGKEIIKRRKEKQNNIPAVFCFDSHGKLLKRYKNSMEAAYKMDIRENVIYSAIRHKCLCRYKYYFSYDEIFVPPYRK